MDAVILAGGAIPEALKGKIKASERALLEIGGQTSLARVIQSLRGVPEIEKIIAVTTPEALKTLPEDVVGLASGEKLTQNLFAGARAASGSRVLIATGDIPLVTSATWAEFLAGAQLKNLDAAFPILRRETCEAQFPGGRRTFATLKDGTFTGGNAFLLPRDRLEALESLIETAYNARKKPFKLATMLGLGFMWKALTKRLRVAEVEGKMSRILDCRGGAVEMRDATIGFDIDKPEDLEAAERFLASN